ncbi:UDP-glucose 4-epimerase [Candidatus Photodesmus blepharus]|uniref:UDP-glucose 4-epimerase n=1 Tax=Candidatus Photodesmus blepharonis TaxID=1179155 RepID=A0A084CP25_9GAMM|nr:UDP-glucose 4-epimerase GalE [Candidatus Photodesmus blepharus]KEY91554.1 UDP-glucose 4-epimerase [Candidatus Photodesmus blepharus]
MEVLVAGGIGYIGSHTCVKMIESGMQPIIVDSLLNAKVEVLSRIEALTGKKPIFYQGDIRDEIFLDMVFRSHKIQSVLHFAGLKSVSESVLEPLRYYDNNVNGSLVLIRSMRKAGVKSIVFSSSAVVYGHSDVMPVTESFLTGMTTNPYACTKYIVERCLTDLFASESDWSITLLRYFNPVGAHPSGVIGEDPKGIPSNLMPIITQVAIGRREYLSVFGNDYPTPDGTGIRDYIHIMDLVEGHVVALESISGKSGLRVYNLGTGKGFSVFEMIEIFNQVCGVRIPYQICQRRLGDIAECWANPEKAKHDLGWTAKRSMIEIMEDTWRWQLKNPDGY